MQVAGVGWDSYSLLAHLVLAAERELINFLYSSLNSIKASPPQCGWLAPHHIGSSHMMILLLQARQN